MTKWALEKQFPTLKIVANQGRRAHQDKLDGRKQLACGRIRAAKLFLEDGAAFEGMQAESWTEQSSGQCGVLLQLKISEKADEQPAEGRQGRIQKAASDSEMMRFWTYRIRLKKRDPVTKLNRQM
jgi:hypothetical protein